MNVRSLLAAALLALCAVAIAQSPPPGIKRTPLQRFDIDGGKEVVVGIAEIPPGLAAGRHSHPGIETGYMIEGAASLEIDGEPARVLKAGDSYMIPAGKIHDARTLGDKPVKVIATYIIEKGQPLATPAK